MTVEKIFFLLCSFAIIGSALMVVITRRLINAALWLVVTLFSVAILYVLLEAGFLAMVQIVIYIGAIAILFIFSIMLTRREFLEKETQLRPNWWIPSILGILILIGLVMLIIGQTEFIQTANPVPSNVDILRNLGDALVSPEAFLLPFEMASILLLAALVGAVYIASGRNRND